MPTYEHVCDSCLHEWEDTYSIKADPPKICPKCGVESARRVISLGGRGVVELYGQELVDKIKGEAKQLKKDMHKSANVYANLLGEDRYHKLQTQLDRQKK